ncbi:insulinase family protein [Marivibrio halodurans]|uniref:Insulinase family protein n=1 Tax=Marivibrio halodurans TaxID=2039722 RepID=A0A8J7SPZ4_9PROT|nr:pitrilysin family protein [Marivibrio halodurans]MBP5858933.1 insulinase family protein [Marivibrio halodurans]
MRARQSTPFRPSGPRGAVAAFCLALLAVGLMAARPAFAVEVERVVSDKGITAWLVRDDTVPVTAIEFTFAEAGAVMDPDGMAGTANMTSALIDEGAGDMDSQAFQGKLNDLSIKLRYSAGRTDFSGSFYTLNRYRDEAVEMLRLSLTEPRFDEEPVARIRRQIQAGLRQQRTDPGALAAEALMKTVFQGHPYADPTEGTVDSVERVTVEAMRTFQREGLTRDRLNIGVVGDITPEALKPILDKAFGGLPESGRHPDVPQAAVDGPAGTVVIDQDVPQSTVQFAQKGLALDDPDYYAGMVLNHILGGGSFESRLMQEIRVKRGLAYSVYSFLQPMEKAAMLRGGLATRNDAVGQSIDLVREVFADIRDNGVSEAQLADAKTYLTGSYPLRFTNSSSIADQLVAMQRYDFGIDYIDRRNSLIEKVTLADVNRLAGELLDPEALTIVAVGKPEGVEANLPVPDGVGG